MIHIFLSTYNGEKYLSEQFESIIGQSYRDWRLYVRDDGSSDGTCEILNRYAQRDERITLVADERHLGAKDSFMWMLEEYGEADYFAFADQDDIWDANKLEVSMEAMQEAEHRYPDSPIVVHTDLRVVDEELGVIDSSFWHYSNIRPDLLDKNIHYMAICTSVTGCTMIFNRAARACALPMETNAFMHDWWITQRTMLSGGHIIPVYRASVAYRQHGANVLGAREHAGRHKSWKQRKEDVEQVYMRSHPAIFANKIAFWYWKMIYLCHRLLTKRVHG